MSGTFVAAYLLRVTNPLTLRRSPLPVRRREFGAPCDPAVLVIPRSGFVRDPYLVVLGRAGRTHAAPLTASPVGLPLRPFLGSHGGMPAGLAAVDVHIRARIDSSYDHAWQRMADVLVHNEKWPLHAPGKQLAILLGRFPGCAVITGHHRCGCLVAMRDGRTVEISGSPIFQSGGGAAWSAVYGSVIHSWLSAGLPLSTIEDAVVVAGHCAADIDADADDGDGDGREAPQLFVSARTHIRVIPAQGRWRRRSLRPSHLFPKVSSL